VKLSKRTLEMLRGNKEDPNFRSMSVESMSVETDSNDSELFSDPTFLAHFEDAENRSWLLRSLIRVRNDFGLTQEIVARTMETTQSAISQLESGSTDPRLSTLQRYARAVNAHLQVRLNVYSVIAQEPSHWPKLVPGESITSNLIWDASAFPHNHEMYRVMLKDQVLVQDCRSDENVPS